MNIKEKYNMWYSIAYISQFFIISSIILFFVILFNFNALYAFIDVYLYSFFCNAQRDAIENLKNLK